MLPDNKIWREVIIWDRAQIWNNAEIWNNTEIWTDTQIWKNTKIWAGVIIWNDAEIWYDVQIWEWARICAWANISIFSKISPYSVVDEEGNLIGYLQQEERVNEKQEERGKSKWEARELLEKTFWKKLLKKRRRRSSSFFDFPVLEGESARISWKIRIGSDFFLMTVVCWNFSSNIGYTCRQSFRNSF